MPRIRTVKPEFFTHYDLFQAEKESGLPIRIAFAGLWCCSDKEGRFKWRIAQLKLNVLPYDDVDFEKILKVLIDKEFIFKYMIDGNEYGCVPTLKEHQRFSGKEAQTESKIPAPPIKRRKREAPGKHPGSNGEAPGNTGRERSKERSKESGGADLGVMCYDIKKFLEDHQKEFEAICMASPIKDRIRVNSILEKFHLYNVENGRYPKNPIQLIAGFKKWLLNEKDYSKNGHNSTATIGKTFEPD